MTAIRLQAVLQRIDALSLRERLLLLAASIAVLAGLWEAVLVGPLAAREQMATAELETLEQQLAALNEAMSLAASEIGEGVPGKLERLDLLQRRVDEAAEAVRVFTSELVDPKQMRVVLEELIRRQEGLRLVSMSNLAVEPLMTGDSPAGEADGPRLYRHGLVLVLEGSYLECMEYLQAVERLPWQLYWARLELEHDDYPTNRILVELHTLSLEEDWIGV